MKKGVNLAVNFISRYVILLVVGILNTGVFYPLFTPLTVYPVYFLLAIFFSTSLSTNVLLVRNIPIEIIGPCVAGSAYYLLLILNLSTPSLSTKKRIGMLFFSFISLLIVNILRIFFLSYLLVSGFSYFDLAHKMLWYCGSIVFVVVIWFLTVKIFKVEEVPFYSDIISLLKLRRKKTKRSKKH